METKLYNELLAHTITTITCNDLTDFDDLHYHAFNEDYYIIGYYQAEQWLAGHSISAFEAIADIIEWERNTFGEVTITPEDINSERIVNLYVYIKGEELLSDFNLDQSQADLLSDMREALD